MNGGSATFYPQLQFDKKYGDPGDINPRAAWEEAKILVFMKLRQGIHPLHFGNIIAEALRSLVDECEPEDEYRKGYLEAAEVIVRNLRRHGIFENDVALYPLDKYKRRYSKNDQEFISLYEVTQGQRFALSKSELEDYAIDEQSKAVIEQSRNLESEDIYELECFVKTLQLELKDHEQDHFATLINKFGWTAEKFEFAELTVPAPEVFETVETFDDPFQCLGDVPRKYHPELPIPEASTKTTYALNLPTARGTTFYARYTSQRDRALGSPTRCSRSQDNHSNPMRDSYS